MLKRVTVLLKSGISVKHELEVPDDAAYMQQIDTLIDHLKNSDEGVLVFTSPSVGIYRYGDILGIQFVDPPDKRPPMGFKPAAR